MQKPFEPADQGKRRHPGENALASYVAGRLPAAERARLASHVADCAVCRNRLSRQAQLWAALDQWSPPAVTASFDRRLWRRLAQQQPAPGWEAVCRAAATKMALSRWRSVAVLTIAGALAIALWVHGWVRHPAPGLEPTPAETSGIDVADIESIERALEDLELLRTAAF